MGPRWRRGVATRLFIGVLLATAGCGDMQAADGSSIEVNPSTVTYTLLDPPDPACATLASDLVHFRVIVRNPEGVPLNDIDVALTLQTPRMFFVEGTTLLPDMRIVRRPDDRGILEVAIAFAYCEFGNDVLITSGTATSMFHLDVKASGGGSGNVPPTAAATVIPATGAGTAGVTNFAFDGSTSGDSDGSIVSYDWDFGDGNTATGATVNHTYAAAGTYTATLTVTDDGGATATDTLTIDVAP